MNVEEALFAALEAENHLGKLKEDKAVIVLELDKGIAKAEKDLAAAKYLLKELVGGEDVIVKDTHQNWKVTFTKPKGKTVVSDIDAAPDEFVKIEKKPDLKAIREYLDENGLTNWASIETAEPEITWRAVKK